MAASLKKMELVYKPSLKTSPGSGVLISCPSSFQSFFFFEKGSGNNTYRCCVVASFQEHGSWKDQIFFIFMWPIFCGNMSSGSFLRKTVLTERPWNLYMPLEHSKYFVPEILCQSKKKSTCFFLESCVVQRHGCFQFIFSFVLFFLQRCIMVYLHIFLVSRDTVSHRIHVCHIYLHLL